MFKVLLYGQISPPGQLCRQGRRAGTGERVKHEIAFFRESRYQWLDNLDGFLVRVQPVARVGPRMDVIEYHNRDRRITLGEQERLFMPVIQVS